MEIIIGVYNSLEDDGYHDYSDEHYFLDLMDDDYCDGRYFLDLMDDDD